MRTILSGAGLLTVAMSLGACTESRYAHDYDRRSPERWSSRYDDYPRDRWQGEENASWNGRPSYTYSTSAPSESNNWWYGRNRDNNNYGSRNDYDRGQYGGASGYGSSSQLYWRSPSGPQNQHGQQGQYRDASRSDGSYDDKDRWVSRGEPGGSAFDGTWNGGQRPSGWYTTTQTPMSDGDLPASVRTAFQKQGGGTSSQITEVTKGIWNGTTYYCGKANVNGKPYKMVADSDGNLVMMHRADMDPAYGPMGRTTTSVNTDAPR